MQADARYDHNTMISRGLLVVCLWLLAAGNVLGDVAWIEAETPAATNFPEKHPFMPATPAEKAVLSGGAWIGVDGRRQETLFAEYRFTVTEPRPHQLFARKFWKHGPFRWRIDDREYQKIDKNAALIDRADVRKNVEASWVGLGSVDLPAGEHTLRIELTDNWGPAAFDCFVVTSEPFTPRGAFKPGAKIGTSMPGWFAFEPDEDDFRDSPIDMRRINEAVAGENGRVLARGERLGHEKTGQTLRFWGVNARADIVGIDPATAERLGRQLAKQGVNLVRIHMPAGDHRGPDAAAIDRIQRFVVAMKKQGIYTSLSIYFPLWITFDESDGFGAYNKQHPFGVVFFDDKFQIVYRSWFKELLTRPNPHDAGRPLCDEPAVAIVEMVNEDSLFFWTFKPYEAVPARAMEILERRFAEWLTIKYGSLDAATGRWPAFAVRGDNFPRGRVGVMPLWDIINRKGPRAEDTAAFLCDVQTQFFTEMQAFLRNDCRYPGLTVASNWVTADGRILGPLDKLSNTVADVMDRHGYYAGKHTGPRSGYAIDAGDRYFDRAAVRFDPQDGPDPEKPSFNTPVWDLGYTGKPSIISEVGWTAPNRFRAEIPLIAAAYGSLQGTDGFMFFALESVGWDATLRKFTIQSPAIAGQFPAAALAYRRGDIAEADTVVHVAADPAELRQLKGALVQQSLNLDQLRAEGTPPTDADAGRPAVDPLAHIVGKVGLSFSADANSTQTDLSKFIDRHAKVVTSSTGQLKWDYGRGVITLSAPRVIAAAGFLGSVGPMDLGGVTFDIKNDFAAVWLISLDDQPLEQSKRMLLQVMTEEMNNGFAATADSPRKITSLGASPVCVREIAGQVTFAGPVRVTPLDFNGYARGTAREAGPLLGLETGTMHYLVER